MTVTRQGPGVVLLLSREELPPPPHTWEDLLPLISDALLRAGFFPSRAVEVRAFPGRQGTLFLLLPAPTPPEGNFFCGLS